MELSDRLLCLFNAEVTVMEDEYVISVPEREVETGGIEPGSIYRIAVVDQGGDQEARTAESPATGHPDEPQPPVEAGEVRYVEIEDLGDQGDGIAKVERGYVLIVPGGEVGERVKIEIADVKPNFAVGEIIDGRDEGVDPVGSN
ncbi:MAG: TRAM domain-containing protein [Halobacteriaceae archaeon]